MMARTRRFNARKFFRFLLIFIAVVYAAGWVLMLLFGLTPDRMENRAMGGWPEYIFELILSPFLAAAALVIVVVALLIFVGLLLLIFKGYNLFDKVLTRMGFFDIVSHEPSPATADATAGQTSTRLGQRVAARRQLHPLSPQEIKAGTLGTVVGFDEGLGTDYYTVRFASGQTLNNLTDSDVVFV
ncbi:hypothetical protein GCM10011359_02620 [Nesterenkonia alkaliphila]|nr:hypothetical protein GCM10011359_02620 [Nesterenkonia alkaliphila]